VLGIRHTSRVEFQRLKTGQSPITARADSTTQLKAPPVKAGFQFSAISIIGIGPLDRSGYAVRENEPGRNFDQYFDEPVRVANSNNWAGLRNEHLQ
jgi:hypothetical protein